MPHFLTEEDTRVRVPMLEIFATLLDTTRPSLADFLLLAPSFRYTRRRLCDPARCPSPRSSPGHRVVNQWSGLAGAGGRTLRRSLHRTATCVFVFPAGGRDVLHTHNDREEIRSRNFREHRFAVGVLFCKEAGNRFCGSTIGPGDSLC